jgi:hypothetical protein
VNPETIDSEYSKLEQAVQDTAQAITNLAQKMQTAAGSGDANARDWVLDLKAIALQVQQDHLQMQSLMQAMHDFTVSHLSQQSSGPAPQPVYAPQPQYVQQPAMGGGMLGRFLGGGFGRAIAMGAGFGIGDDIINSIF